MKKMEFVFQRKLYDRMLQWKQEEQGQTALLIEGVRRVGKSTLAETFAKKEYRSYILIDFNKASKETKGLFDDLSSLDFIFLRLQAQYGVQLYERQSVIVFDEVQKCPNARQAIKYLVEDGRYDYIETGSLISIRKNTKDITIPSEEERVQLALVEESCGRGFYWTPLTDAPLVAVVPPDFPWQEDTIPLERLLQETFLSCPEQYVARLLPPGSPLLEVTASDDAAILSMVAAGLGVSVLSSFSLAGYEGQVHVLPLSQPLFRRLGAAVKTPPPANSAARHFLAFLKRQYPNKPTDNP